MIPTSMAPAEPFGPLLLLSSSVAPRPPGPAEGGHGEEELARVLRSSTSLGILCAQAGILCAQAGTGLRKHRHPET